MIVALEFLLEGCVADPGQAIAEASFEQ